MPNGLKQLSDRLLQKSSLHCDTPFFKLHGGRYSHWSLQFLIGRYNFLLVVTISYWSLQLLVVTISYWSLQFLIGRYNYWSLQFLIGRYNFLLVVAISYWSLQFLIGRYNYWSLQFLIGRYNFLSLQTHDVTGLPVQSDLYCRSSSAVVLRNTLVRKVQHLK
jgi:hypothetical protein